MKKNMYSLYLKDSDMGKSGKHFLEWGHMIQV